MSSRHVCSVLLASLVLLSGCTDESPPDVSVGGSTSSEKLPGPTARPLRPVERAAQLAALAPEQFDAVYRLDSRGSRPDARVRMRTRGDRFRLDLQQGGTTAVLLTGRRGVVSCQVERRGDPKRTCFLVANRPRALPPLFDPQVQRLFRSVTGLLSRPKSGLRVHPAATWRAPHDLGQAECFDVRGQEVDRGVYCFLSRPGNRIGLLARVKFPSGTLSLRSVNHSVRTETFHSPVRPTPLPN